MVILQEDEHLNDTIIHIDADHRYNVMFEGPRNTHIVSPQSWMQSACESVIHVQCAYSIDMIHVSSKQQQWQRAINTPDKIQIYAHTHTFDADEDSTRLRRQR